MCRQPPASSHSHRPTFTIIAICLSDCNKFLAVFKNDFNRTDIAISACPNIFLLIIYKPDCMRRIRSRSINLSATGMLIFIWILNKQSYMDCNVLMRIRGSIRVWKCEYAPEGVNRRRKNRVVFARRRPKSRTRTVGCGQRSKANYLMMEATAPAPTVRPPSRMEKRVPSSTAIGAIS